MKHVRLMWFVAALIAVVYTITFLVVRIDAVSEVQQTQYTQWKTAYIVQQESQKSFVNTSGDAKNPVALSEAQGYGLYITAMAGAYGWADRRAYDDLLNYYLAHRDSTGDRHNVPTYLMQWRQYKDSGGKWVSENNSATDGDLFIAYSLDQARKVWPQRATYYQTIERRLTADILTYEYNATTRTLTVGDWATPESPFHDLLRTSDVIPSFFDAFHALTKDSRWITVKNTMLDRMVNLSDQSATGLVPDFAWVTADGGQAVKGKTIESKHDGDYSFNACRVPMMLAWSTDRRATKVVHGILDFFEKQDVITAGYTLTGKPINSYQSNSFISPLVYAASHSTQSDYGRILAKKNAIILKSSQSNSYYDATLTTMAIVKGIK